jgi:hypothetical protein
MVVQGILKNASTYILCRMRMLPCQVICYVCPDYNGKKHYEFVILQYGACPFIDVFQLTLTIEPV